MSHRSHSHSPSLLQLRLVGKRRRHASSSPLFRSLGRPGFMPCSSASPAHKCACVGLSGSGTVVETCSAGWLWEHEVEEDGVNVWSELYRMGKSHTFATPTLRNTGIITGFLMVAHCKAFCSLLMKSTALSEGKHRLRRLGRRRTCSRALNTQRDDSRTPLIYIFFLIHNPAVLEPTRSTSEFAVD